MNLWNNAPAAAAYDQGRTADAMGEFITDDYKERVQAVFRNALNGVETANFEFARDRPVTSRCC